MTTTTTTDPQAPLAEMLWRLGALIPWLGAPGAAEAADPAHRHPAAAAALRRMQEEQRAAMQTQFALASTALGRAGEAVGRMAAARDPMEVVAAQAGLGLALAELAAAPARAWLDALPKLHACCMAMANDPPEPSFAPQAPPGPEGDRRGRAMAAAAAAPAA
jgi:hypothetical protein